MSKDSKFRDHAENSIRYFARIAQENNAEVWRKGLSTAQEWLRLINSVDCSEEEISSFLGVVHANRHRTSGWYDLAYGAYSWARFKGYPVPLPEDFFAPSQLSSIQNLSEMPSSDQARELLKTFQQYHLEDPSSEVWEAGIKLTELWLSLIEAQEVKKSEIAPLIELLNLQKYDSQEWFVAVLRISYWCKRIGHVDLVPDDLRGRIDRFKD